MMNAHTPGPWIVEPPASGDGDISDASMPQCHSFISSSNWSALARVVTRMEGETADSEEGLANARLIRAAPDLYTALKALLEAAEKHIFSDECQAQRYAARAAIAYAERKV